MAKVLLKNLNGAGRADKADFPPSKYLSGKTPKSLLLMMRFNPFKEFIITKEVKSVAKDAIKLALAGGMEVQGCHLEQGTRLSIN